MAIAVYRETYLRNEPLIRCGICGRSPSRAEGAMRETILHDKECPGAKIVCVFGPNSVKRAKEYEDEEIGEMDYSGIWRGMKITEMRRLQGLVRAKQREAKRIKK